jgi:hypothetical protein
MFFALGFHPSVLHSKVDMDDIASLDPLFRKGAPTLKYVEFCSFILKFLIG